MPLKWNLQGLVIIINVAMRIHVSASTHALLSKDETFRMTRRDEVELKVILCNSRAKALSLLIGWTPKMGSIR